MSSTHLSPDRTFATVLIDAPGLMWQSVRVLPGSAVAVAQHAPDGGQLMVGLDVDGRFVGLCFWKHTVGRPELDTAVVAARQLVQAAIDALALALAVGAAQADALGIAAPQNCLGEPLPSGDDEALARQLVAEIDEAGLLIGEWPRRPELRRAYEAKSMRVREMGYEIGPDGRGGLCLWHGDNSGPVHV